MKRHKNLFEEISSLENLYVAARKAARGKRWRDSTLAFNVELESNLSALRLDLRSRSYIPGRYHSFKVYDPKERLISAAPFRDRVVHHALCNVIEPIFERSFIYDSYACRPGKGTHAALDRYTRMARRNSYVLQCDIARYFPSIDHELLKEKIRRKIGCPETLWLVDRIIDTGPHTDSPWTYFPGDTLFTPFERRRGIPIGNQTSQFFSNVYLNDFDHFVKESQLCLFYLRYVDDFLILGNDRRLLEDLRLSIRERLERDRLRLHRIKQRIHRTREGIRFLGFRVFPDHRLVGRESVARFRRRLRGLQEEWEAGERDLDRVRQTIAGWLGHVRHGDSWGLRRSVLREFRLS